MKVIGITGGVGAGKTEILNLIDKMCSCIILRADELARSLEMRGEECYEPLVSLLGDDVLAPDGQIDAQKMAQLIFTGDDESLCEKVNAIVHPAVKRRILSMIEDAENEGVVDYFFIEAALLIEDHYDTIVDELWYIYADEDIRRKRLKEHRQYSDEKITAIMDSQSSDEVFRQHCSVVIDNSSSLDEARRQLERYLSGR